MLKTKCPQCSASITVPEAYKGRHVKCPKCSRSFAADDRRTLGSAAQGAGAATPPLESCGNCGRSIGRLEKAFVWQDQVICTECHGVLQRQQDGLDSDDSGQDWDTASVPPPLPMQPNSGYPPPMAMPGLYGGITSVQTPRVGGQPRRRHFNAVLWILVVAIVAAVGVFRFLRSDKPQVNNVAGSKGQIDSKDAGERPAAVNAAAGSKGRIDSKDAGERLAAVNAARTDADPAAADMLLTALRDPDATVRHAAAIEIALKRDQRAVPTLLRMLSSSDEDKWVASKALGLMREASAVEPLIPLLKSSESMVRNNAADALGLIGDKRAIPDLQALHDTNDPYSADDAALAISRIEHPETSFDPIAKYREVNKTPGEVNAEAANAPHPEKESGIVGSHPWWSLLVIVILLVGATTAAPTRRIHLRTMTGQQIAYADVPTGEAPLADRNPNVPAVALVMAIMIWIALWVVGC